MWHHGLRGHAFLLRGLWCLCRRLRLTCRANTPETCEVRPQQVYPRLAAHRLARLADDCVRKAALDVPLGCKPKAGALRMLIAMPAAAVFAQALSDIAMACLLCQALADWAVVQLDPYWPDDESHRRRKHEARDSWDWHWDWRERETLWWWRLRWARVRSSSVCLGRLR